MVCLSNSNCCCDELVVDDEGEVDEDEDDCDKVRVAIRIEFVVELLEQLCTTTLCSCCNDEPPFCLAAQTMSEMYCLKVWVGRPILTAWRLIPARRHALYRHNLHLR